LKPAAKRRLKRWFWYGFFGFVLIVLLTNRWVVNSTNAYLYTNWSLLPDNDVGLVMGTSPYRSDGKSSAEFYGRVRAAAELYQLGKVKHLIVSGANPDSSYNEPRQMWRELTRLGVPPEAITMDFAGFRTLDSISRADIVFGLKRFTIITTRYHAWRALFIARKMDLDVVAYAAPIDVTGELGRRNPWREIFARTLAVLDVIFLGTEPKVIGEPQSIKLDSGAEKT
jgi:SanA protein